MSDDAFWAEALAAAEAADAADPLAGFRSRFHIPPGMIYLDGNSLGPAPEAALTEIATAAGREWARHLITSWNAADWFELPTRCSTAPTWRRRARMLPTAAHGAGTAG